VDEVDGPERIRRRAEDRPVHKFEETPGEEVAEAARREFLSHAAARPTAALRFPDRAGRQAAVAHLQATRGNRFVQRAEQAANGTPGTPGRLVGRSQPEMVAEVNARKDAGTELPEHARHGLEAHFSADLTGVRVHTGESAATLSRELNAAAFTVGHDVYFGKGQYDPEGSAGQGLLAHELTHVAQQTGLGATEEGNTELVQRQPEEEEDEEEQR
jgi:hypothetical protein